MGRAGRAEKVRAPIGGCNIILGRERPKACGQGCYVVLLSGGEGGKGGKGGKSGKSGKGGKGGKGGKSGKGAGIVLVNGGREGREGQEERKGGKSERVRAPIRGY